MMEALVALLITAIGILGTVSMQGVVLSSTKTANDHSIAALQVGNLVSLMKSNKEYWTNIPLPFDINVDLDGVITDNGDSTEGTTLEAQTSDCTLNACNGAESASYQIKQWARSTSESGFADRLSNARARILRVNAATPVVFELTLEWNQKQAASGLDMSMLFRAGGSRSTGSYVLRVRP